MSLDRPDDLDRGAALRRAMLGDAWVDQSLGQANSLNAEFQSLVTRHAWFDIWGRPGLAPTTRRLLVLGMTMAQGRWEEFELHCRAAIRGGVPLADIRETLLQGAIYCGVPAANTAFKLAVAACKAEGVVLTPAPLLDGLRVETHHTFSLPQLKVALQGAPAGLPVVMSHALGMNLTMWDGLAAHLAPNHPVLRYDHRGQGGSAAAQGAFGLADLVADAARLVQEWGRGPVLFIGLSMGGLVAQGLALAHPGLVRGLVLANTTGSFSAEARASLLQRADAVRQHGMTAVVDGTVERFVSAAGRLANPGLADWVRAQLLRADAASYAATCEAIAPADHGSALSAVQCPTLVVSGGLDVGTTPAMGQALASAVPGARHVLIDAAAHLSVLEQPAAFAAAVDSLLAQLEPQR